MPPELFVSPLSWHCLHSLMTTSYVLSVSEASMSYCLNPRSSHKLGRLSLTASSAAIPLKPFHATSCLIPEVPLRTRHWVELACELFLGYSMLSVMCSSLTRRQNNRSLDNDNIMYIIYPFAERSYDQFINIRLNGRVWTG